MGTAKKILAVLVMGLCIVGILLAFTGIVGSWALNRMAMKSGDAFLLRADATLNGLDSGLDSAQNGLSTADQLLGQIEGVPLVGGLLAPLSQNVDRLNAQLIQMNGQVGQLQSMVDTLQKSFHTWLNLATLFADIFLLWFGASQVSLFYHAMDWYREEKEITAKDAKSVEL